MPQLRVVAGHRPGRSHRRLGLPCQDATASWSDPAAPRAIAAVADGLGSCPLSEHGSRAAADAAVAFLAAAPAWDRDTLVAAFAAARAAVAGKAAELGATPHDLATTLQVAVLDGDRVLAGMVGDGAVVAGTPRQALLVPRPGRYANEVVPLVADGWLDELQVAEAAGGPVAVFSDGLTRLLLARRDGAWQPFAPFFDAFLPALRAGDPGLVQRWLDGDDVDDSWDDDKSMVVVDAA